MEVMCPHPPAEGGGDDLERRRWISESQQKKISEMYQERQAAENLLIKQMRDNITTLQAGQVAVSVAQPQNPVEGQLWFDKAALQLKIYISDGNSSQWVEI